MRIKKFRPRIAVLTNISADHLNWHKDINEYIKAKKRIFMNQIPEDFAILNYNDKIIRTMEKDIKARIIFFGEECYNGAWLDGVLHFQNDDIIHTDEIPLLGIHNWINALAAIAVGRILKIANEDIKMGIKKIKPLPHRLEDVGVIAGIRYINNSMSTNEASAIASFQAVPGNKIVIAGGREKGDRGENYLRLLVEQAKAVVILGENAKEIAEFFDNNQYKKYTIVNNMQEAIASAKKFANPGDVIMLNPGFASFGHFRDFQERGDTFKNGVLKH
jgi:UDP-N-acetylmuramoylalanine--D-glutamate ligase